jgi:hypothetical protein
MAMDRHELQELMDGLENAGGLASITDAQREVLGKSAEIVDGLLGCEVCQGMKWYVWTKASNEAFIHACPRCVNIPNRDGDDNREEVAVLKVAVEFINKAREAVQKVE